MKSVWYIIFVLCIAACQQASEDAESIPSVRVDSSHSYADIIRNPISASKPLDTVNIAKMSFADTAYHFGTVKSGQTITRSFEFVNTGKVPLVIQDARSTCGCTVPSWPKDAIAPGVKGIIKVVFNTENKVGAQNKPITITANTYPNETVLYMTGQVNN